MRCVFLLFLCYCFVVFVFATDFIEGDEETAEDDEDDDEGQIWKNREGTETRGNREKNSPHERSGVSDAPRSVDQLTGAASLCPLLSSALLVRNA